MNDDEAIAFLLALLRIESPTGNEERAVSFVAAHFEQCGLTSFVDEVGNAIARTRATSERELMFLGHVDTVPGAFPVEQNGEVIFGRGAVDAKGPLATAVVAATRCTHIPGLAIVAAVGEEGPSHGARHLLLGRAPQALIIGEPGGSDSIVLGYKGSMRACLTFQQPSAHSAGRTATVCDAAVNAWSRVKAACTDLSLGSDNFQMLTPTLLAFDSESDGLTDRARLRSTFRLPPGLDLEDARTAIAEAALPAEVEFHEADAGFRASRTSPLVASFLRSLRAEELAPRFKYKTGTSDMNVVGPVWNCPTVAYGPGDSSLDHTPEEHIRSDEYLQGIRVLTRVFSDWR